MKSILLLLLLQSASPVSRLAMVNPASVTEVPKPLKKDYDKFWTRFQTGKDKDDAGLTKDLDKFLAKNPGVPPAIVIEAYIDEIHGRPADAAQKFNNVLTLAPSERIALSFLADFSFDRQEYPRAVELYNRLLQVDSTRTDVEPKRQKALILGTDNLLRQAAQSEQENRLTDAESLYRQALQLAPGEPSLYGRLGTLLAREKNWSGALTNFEKQRQLSGPTDDIQRHIAEALTNLGRMEEAKAILSDSKGPNAVTAVSDTRDGQLLEDLGRWGKDIDRFHQIQASAALTREQFALLIVRYFPQIADLPSTVRGIVVTDSQSSAARQEIQTVLGLGLIEPFPNHTFRPAAPLNRGEFAAAIVRLSKLLGVAPAQAASSSPSANDVQSGNARYGDVQFVLNLKLLTLDGAGNFNLAGPVAGNQAVHTMQRLLDLIQAKPGF